MAKKVLLRDVNDNEIMPITRGELILDSSGNPAFHSNEFLATDSQPGLMSAEDKYKIINMQASSVANALTLKINNGSVEGTNLYTYNGSVAKTLNIIAGDNITLTPTDGVLSISANIPTINDVYTKTESDNRYLRLSGGTLILEDRGSFSVKRNKGTGYGAYIQYENSEEILGHLGLYKRSDNVYTADVYFGDGSNYQLIHSGNIGDGLIINDKGLSVDAANLSVKNADTVGGLYNYDFVRRTDTQAFLPKFVLEEIPKNLTQVGSIGWEDSQNHPYAGGLFLTLKGISSLRTAMIIFPDYWMKEPPLLYSSIDNLEWQGGYQLAYRSDIPTSLPANGGNADTLGGYLPRNVDIFFTQAREKELDLTALDSNYYYPCAIHLTAVSPAKIRIWCTLGDRPVPSWATHSDGFVLNLEWEAVGCGWGTTSVQRKITTYHYAFSDKSPCGDITQNTMPSEEIVFLRGGAKYFYHTSNGGYFVVHPNGYSWSSGDRTVNHPIRPLSEAVDVWSCSDNSALGIGAIVTNYVYGTAAKADKLSTPRTIWGQSFDGSGDVSGIAYFPNGDLIYAKDEGGTYRYVMGLTSGLSFGYGSAAVGIDTYILGKNIHFRYYDTDYKYAMSILNNGNVGIGTTNPQYKLDVNGDMHVSNSIGMAGELINKAHYLFARGDDNANWIVTDKFWKHEYTLLHTGNIGNGLVIDSSGLSVDSSKVVTVSGRQEIEGKDFTSTIAVTSGNDAKIIFNNTDDENYYQYISFRQKGTEYSTLGTLGDGELRWGSRKVLHEGNIGSQSVNYANSAGNADKLDGYHYNGLPYISTSGGSANGTISACNSGASNPGNAAFEAREYARAGTDTSIAPHSVMYAPRIGFHWGNRYWANLIYYDSVFRFMDNDGDSYQSVCASGFIHTTYWSSAYALTSDGGVAHIGSMSVNYASSAGNADTVDGYHESSFLRYRDLGSNGGDTLWSQIGIRSYHGALPEGLSGIYNFGEVVSLPGSGSRLDIFTNHVGSSESGGLGGLWWRSGWNDDKKSWRRIIDSGNIGSQSVNYANSASYAASVLINYNDDSNSTYQMLWGSGNYVYGTGGIYCNPAVDYLYAGSMQTSNWFRSTGNTGWYNESYGGGWYMIDTSWIRSYNGHGVIAGGFYHGSYGSSAYALTSDGGVAHIGSMSVNYANSAGSVAWSNVTGKPSTFTPSSHNHSQVLDISNSSATTFAYSKAGLNYGDYTWLAGWNGYELRAVNKNQFALASHTHAYLPLAGGTMNTTALILVYTRSKGSGDIYNGAILLREATGSGTACADTMYDAPGITFHWSGKWVHKLNMHTDALYWDNNKLWHAGNDGSGSGLDADVVDGYHIVVTTSLPANKTNNTIYILV